MIDMTDDVIEAEIDSEVEAQARQYYAERAYRPSVEELQERWDALSFDDQMRIWDQFAIDSIDGSREPNEYWYPLLMPKMLEGYTGD